MALKKPKDYTIILLVALFIYALLVSSCTKETTNQETEKPVLLQLVDVNDEPISNQVHVK